MYHLLLLVYVSIYTNVLQVYSLFVLCISRVKMPSEPKDPALAPTPPTRAFRSALLRKQPEIEEVDEDDTSPSSDQSDSTITAGKFANKVTVGISIELLGIQSLNVLSSTELECMEWKVKSLGKSYSRSTGS